MRALGHRIAGPLLVVLTLAVASACGSLGQKPLSQNTSGSSAADRAPESRSAGPTDHQGGDDQDDHVRVRALERCPAPGPADPPPTEQGIGGATGQHLPAITLPCLGRGPAVLLSQGRAVPTVVNLWASWCVPCKLEMPRLREAAGRAGSQALFLGVDIKDEPAAGARFLARAGIHYPQVQDRTGQLLADLRLPGIPLTYVLDPTGVIRYRHIGQMQAQDVAELESVLVSSR